MPTNVQLAWLKQMVPAAQATARVYKVPASVTLAQCILESGWGTSQLSRQANNYFGIKAVRGQGYVEFPTREVIKGRSVMEQASFAKYPDVLGCFAEHATLLSGLQRYQPAMKAAGNLELFCEQLQACGYSTNPHYAIDLLQLIHQEDLLQYDQ